MDFVCDKYDRSKLEVYSDILKSIFKYNISILDYFYFKFYDLSNLQRETYAGTGYMYEYQLKMNPKKSRDILMNKFIFLEAYSSYVKHGFCTKEDFLTNDNAKNQLLENRSKKIVTKSSDGQCGEGIEVYDIEKLGKNGVIRKVASSGNDLIEEFILQHQDLMRLSPSGLNTVRIFTQLNKEGKVHFLGARLRITINSSVDNLAAGNIAAPIDVETGIVNGNAVYSDITKFNEEFHPVTKEKIKGFKIPYWKETVKMVRDSALEYPQNKSIGWDIAISDKGPELLEGNHNWCKLLWQLPVKKGLKNELEKYL